MSARSLNKVMLIGNLTRDPNMRYTPTGSAVCSFSIATNRTWTSGDGGEKQEKADFHNIVAWTKLAEVCGQLLHKGDKVYVEGRLQTREWQNKEGQDQRTTEVVIDNMILLTSRGGMSSMASEDVSSGDDAAGSSPADSAGPATTAAPTAKTSTAAKSTKKSKSKTTAEEAPSDDVSGVQDISEEVDIPF